MLGCLLGLGILEVGIRVAIPRMAVPDEKLGWRPAPGGDRLDRTSFRIFGDPDSARPKLLILGDSFTYARGVHPEKAYPGILSQGLPLEVFAFGGEGYGTLQEHLVYDAMADLIRPDWVLLQVHEDDLCNNSYECERTDWNMVHDNGMRRPYLSEDGGIFYANPAMPGARTRAAAAADRLRRRSRAADVVFRALEAVLRRSRPARPEMDRAAAGLTTGRILDMVAARGRGRGTRLAAFSSAGSEDEIRALCEAAGIGFIPGVGRAIREAAARGVPVHAADGVHWSPEGHKIAAAMLADYLRRADPRAEPPAR